MRTYSLRCASGAAGVFAAAALVAVVGLVAALPARHAFAQRPAQPDLSPEEQLAPSQMNGPMPAPVAEPEANAPSTPKTKTAPKHTAAAAAAAKPATKPDTISPMPRPGSNKTVVDCTGPFAKDSGMLALAVTYDSRNMIFTQETVQGATVGVTVIYPKDPKRRLEVWWQNPNRTGTYLIDIAGKSTWTAPKGLRLGLTLEQVQKLNRKPFKLKGFDADGAANVADWDGGELASLPGGCKASATLHTPDKSAAGDLPAKDEYSSDDPAMRALKPTVSEILIGY
jgi:hypothetical protein